MKHLKAYRSFPAILKHHEALPACPSSSIFELAHPYTCIKFCRIRIKTVTLAGKNIMAYFSACHSSFQRVYHSWHLECPHVKVFRYCQGLEFSLREKDNLEKSNSNQVTSSKQQPSSIRADIN